MLYLPPSVPHHGVAEDPCLTFSIGMRAPLSAELLGDFVDTLAAEADDGQRYVDPDLAPAKDPNEIDAAAMQRVLEALNALRMTDPDRLDAWFGRFLTLYRSAGHAMPADASRSRTQTEWDLHQGHVLHRHTWPLIAWRRPGSRARLHASGETQASPVLDAHPIPDATPTTA